MSIAKSIQHYIEAHKELESAKSDCDGSWGYFLHSQITEVEKAGNEVEESITKIIKKVVRAMIE